MGWRRGVRGLDPRRRLPRDCRQARRSQAPSVTALRALLNRALADSGLAYEIDRPFIGDPDGLETGAIVTLGEGRTLMRAADGWMDPATGRIRARLPGPVRQALVMTPGREPPVERRRKTPRR